MQFQYNYLAVIAAPLQIEIWGNGTVRINIRTHENFPVCGKGQANYAQLKKGGDARLRNQQALILALQDTVKLIERNNHTYPSLTEEQSMDLVAKLNGLIEKHQSMCDRWEQEHGAIQPEPVQKKKKGCMVM